VPDGDDGFGVVVAFRDEAFIGEGVKTRRARFEVQHGIIAVVAPIDALDARLDLFCE